MELSVSERNEVGRPRAGWRCLRSMPFLRPSVISVMAIMCLTALLVNAGTPDVICENTASKTVAFEKIEQILQMATNDVASVEDVWFILLLDNASANTEAVIFLKPDKGTGRIHRGSSVTVSAYFSVGGRHYSLKKDYVFVSPGGVAELDFSVAPSNELLPFTVCGTISDEDLLALVDSFRRQVSDYRGLNRVNVGNDPIFKIMPEGWPHDTEIGNRVKVLTASRRRSLAGRGRCYTMEKKGKKWTIVEPIGIWVS